MLVRHYIWLKIPQWLSIPALSAAVVYDDKEESCDRKRASLYLSTTLAGTSMRTEMRNQQEHH